MSSNFRFARERGRADERDGVSREDNPYESGSFERAHWFVGWDQSYTKQYNGHLPLGADEPEAPLLGSDAWCDELRAELGTGIHVALFRKVVRATLDKAQVGPRS